MREQGTVRCSRLVPAGSAASRSGWVSPIGSRSRPSERPDLGPEGWSAGGSRTAPDDHACSPRLVYGCGLVRCGAIARWTRDRSPGRSRHLERVRRAQPRLSHRLATASGNHCARVVIRSGMDLARPLCPEDGSGDSRRTNPYGDAWSAGAAGWPERPRPDSTAQWTRDRPPCFQGTPKVSVAVRARLSECRSEGVRGPWPFRLIRRRLP
jgi:hypothetical protein